MEQKPEAEAVTACLQLTVFQCAKFVLLSQFDFLSGTYVETNGAETASSAAVTAATEDNSAAGLPFAR